MSPRLLLTAAALLLAASAARADLPGPAPIANCVSDDAVLRPGAGDSAVLSAGDRDRVSDEMMRRYPMLERDGFAAPQIVLWHPADGDWLYVTLIPSPEAPGGVCFTATFAAAEFEVTGAMVAKYFAGK
jgi:hypothetical protein